MQTSPLKHYYLPALVHNVSFKAISSHSKRGIRVANLRTILSLWWNSSLNGFPHILSPDVVHFIQNFQCVIRAKINTPGSSVGWITTLNNEVRYNPEKHEIKHGFDVSFKEET